MMVPCVAHFEMSEMQREHLQAKGDKFFFIIFLSIAHTK